MKQATGWKPGCLALDYDNTEREKVEQSLIDLIHKHELGDCHIYKSSENSYHAYFFQDTRISHSKEIEIMKQAKHVDQEFIEYQEQRDQTRMRIKGKHKENIKPITEISTPYEGNGHPQKAERLKKNLERMIQ